MLVSNHHARELVTPELALRTAQNLVKEYKKGDTKAKQILDKNQVYLLYTMNPDGLHSVWNGNVWQRKNGRGVDLNRNYPVGWKMACGGDSDPSSEGYRGKQPLSEMETQTMQKWQAHRNFAKVLDVHSNARNLRVNYGCAPLPKKIHQHQVKMAQKVAKKMGYPQGQSCCMGGDIHMAYQAHGSLSYLLELGGDSFQPDGHQRAQVLKEVYPGVKHFFSLPISLQGHVYFRAAKTSKPKSEDELVQVGETESVSKVPAVVSIALEGEDFKLGEMSYTHPPTGRYHMWAPPGKYTLRIKTIGESKKQIEKKVQVNIGEHGSFKDIYLDAPSNSMDMAESRDRFSEGKHASSGDFMKPAMEEVEVAAQAYKAARHGLEL